MLCCASLGVWIAISSRYVSPITIIRLAVPPVGCIPPPEAANPSFWLKSVAACSKLLTPIMMWSIAVNIASNLYRIGARAAALGWGLPVSRYPTILVCVSVRVPLAYLAYQEFGHDGSGLNQVRLYPR